MLPNIIFSPTHSIRLMFCWNIHVAQWQYEASFLKCAVCWFAEDLCRWRSSSCVTTTCSSFRFLIQFSTSFLLYNACFHPVLLFCCCVFCFLPPTFLKFIFSSILFIKPLLFFSNTHLQSTNYTISFSFPSSTCKWSCGSEDQPDASSNYPHGCHPHAHTQVARWWWPHPGLRVPSRQQCLHRPSLLWQVTG